MLKIFSRGRCNNEAQIQDIKREHRKTAREFHRVLKDANNKLTNGFAIKVYHASHGGKHVTY